MGPETRNDLKISIRVRSHLRYSDLFHTVLGQVARLVPLPPERLDWIALSLREAVNNAVLHGNKNDFTKWVEVEMEVSGSVFTIRVWDEGAGFSPGVLSDPRRPENLFKPNGRGIFLIRQFTDHADFARSADGRFGICMSVDLDSAKDKEADE
ncbi:MAG: ATP-binding protein [Acidobacteriota bacterium]